MSIEAGWLSEERDAEGLRRFVPLKQDLFGEAEAIPALVIESSGERSVIPFSFQYAGRYPYRSRRMYPDFNNGTRLPCVFTGPYGGEQTAALGSLGDAIALSDREQYVVDALRIIDPEISAVLMFGDGLNRLFGVALSLVNAKDGLTQIGGLDQAGREMFREKLFSPGELLPYHGLAPDASSVRDVSHERQLQLFEKNGRSSCRTSPRS